MVHQMPTHRDILKYNRHLPDLYKQCSVALEFDRHMPVHTTENFYRVRLTRGMFNSGENNFWIPEIIQPRSCGLQKCLGCNHLMKRLGVMSTTCTNKECQYSGRQVMNGPKRGVHSIQTEFDVTNPQTGKEQTVSFVVGREWRTVELDVWINVGLNKLRKKGFNVNPGDWSGVEQQAIDSILTYLTWPERRLPIDIVVGCLIVLDRRYSDAVLCAVWRTCGELCDQMGWKIK